MSEPESAAPANIPPSLMPDALPPEDTSRWPMVIGVLSLSYALGGMLCVVAGSVWTLFIGTFLAKLSGAEVTLPMPVKIAYITLFLANLVLGVLMLLGAVALLRRKRSGVRLLRRWAVLRMLLLLVGAVVTIFTIPSQVDLQREIVEAGNRQRQQQKLDPLPIPSDEDLFRSMIIQSAVLSGVFAIYPLFLGFYLSRRSIHEQIEHWPNS